MRMFLKAGVLSPAMIILFLCGAGEAFSSQEQTVLSDIRMRLDYADSIRKADNPDSAIVISKAALKQIERDLGKSHPLYLSCLKILADSYNATDDYVQRLNYNKTYFSMAESDSAIDRALVAQVGHSLGQICRFLNRFSEAELYLRKTLTIMEDTSMFSPHESAINMKELAAVFISQLRYAEAESLLGRAIVMCQEAHKDDDYEFAEITNALGYLCFDRGLYSQAESLYKVGAAIREKRGGPETHSLSESLNNLGEVFEVWGRYAEAELFYLRALRIREKGMGYKHPYLYYHLANLGELCAFQGRYTEADHYLKRALEIVLDKYGSEHSQVARCLKALGDLYRWQGDGEKAESYYLRALQTNRKIFGSDHPDVTHCLNGLALLYGSSSDYTNSLARFKELLTAKLSIIENVFSYASEDQKMRFADQYALVDGSFLSLVRMDESRESKVQALEMILKGKGIVFDALSAERQMAYCLHDDNVTAVEDQHRLVCEKISTMTLANMRKGKIQQEYLDTLQILRSAKDSLETVLSRMCSSFGEKLIAEKFTVDDVAAALPERSVLWEFVRYEPYDFLKRGNNQERIGPARYLAFTLDRSGNLTSNDLGDAAQIDSLVGLARKLIYQYRTLTSSSTAESERRLNLVTTRLYELIFAPLEAHLDGQVDIIISPDGQLSLLPFEILFRPDGSYVVEEFSISYLSSGRDLLRFGDKSEPAGWAMVLADPDFDFSNEVSIQAGARKHFAPSALYYAFEPARGVSGCLDVPFNPLGETRQEANAIGSALKTKVGIEVSIHHGSDACEEFLKSMDTPPWVLHLATHGFFCADVDLYENKMLENPLLRCGLAFSRANTIILKGKTTAQSEDGILTGFEASGLNLFGTELVVLSACETGLGEVKNGEGVYGLRRAFQRAGARTIIMSLWKVRDEETRKLMTRFYEVWLSGGRKKDALRQAVLSVLSDRRERGQSTHPLFWGGFVIVGDPN